MLGEDSRIVMAGTEPFHTVETARSPATHDERMPNEVQGAVHDTLLMTQLEVVSGEGCPLRSQEKAATKGGLSKETPVPQITFSKHWLLPQCSSAR
jgi:hypothetical protein